MTKTPDIRRKFKAGPFQSQRALTVRILTNYNPHTAVAEALVKAAEKCS